MNVSMYFGYATSDLAQLMGGAKPLRLFPTQYICVVDGLAIIDLGIRGGDQGVQCIGASYQ